MSRAHDRRYWKSLNESNFSSLCRTANRKVLKWELLTGDGQGAEKKDILSSAVIISIPLNYIKNSFVTYVSLKMFVTFIQPLARKNGRPYTSQLMLNKVFTS